MKYWLDTEFIEDGKTIQLISIGLVSEDGRYYYAESREGTQHFHRADPWVWTNVLPYLKGTHYLKTEADIRDEILKFVGLDQKPEFWAYYGAYDWVVFCRLWGRMIDLPSHFPKFIRDIKQWANDLGNPQLPKQDGQQHHALSDAIWNQKAWEFLQTIQRNRQIEAGYQSEARS
jgi:hypothetical protein